MEEVVRAISNKTAVLEDEMKKNSADAEKKAAAWQGKIEKLNAIVEKEVVRVDHLQELLASLLMSKAQLPSSSSSSKKPYNPYQKRKINASINQSISTYFKRRRPENNKDSKLEDDNSEDGSPEDDSPEKDNPENGNRENKKDNPENDNPSSE
ncbi:hypothetical protein BCR41DRAFT_399781 [Lobosporangium transversale]|uniref:Uncharacterized protein n=1 Tax=Lobosporangium transversale TaxID=64571 RepID=A0A1Y2GF76_9FUNG|nr:hypothetical protein BCR41DRAFT_399781 [Lobosporangium transversale]ORZ07288.1 hypothetical protein BCR41DRAFT_399781 [Lobosporangium transversale]|eukprot:XP_021877951.1 hypothetical protein BCR41DRAFT_399781 [Lobosporangium transversale]